jgi:hypothetical protein
LAGDGELQDVIQMANDFRKRSIQIPVEIKKEERKKERERKDREIGTQTS